MLKNHFDPRHPHRYVRYARMSTDMQNPRSPEQQFDTIELTLRRQGHPWAHAADYRDDGISGRLVKGRPGFTRMLSDLKKGVVAARLILVDSFERFGRADDIGSIRHQLMTRHKILVLTADSQFADPTTPAGRALAAIENIRSIEDGRIKAHNVLRGKRDLASQGRWPGGPMPLGYRLRSVLVDRRGAQEVDGHILVPDPASAMVPPRLFALARETGWGTRRLARALNDDPDIPAGLKPISAEKVRQVLENTLYSGTLTYGRCRTGIVDDRVVRERVDPGEELVVEDFCVPLVDPDLAQAVREQRRAARESRGPARPMRRVEVESEGDPERTTLIVPRNHLLTGLVRCGSCGGSMRISSSSFELTTGPARYAYYGCWRYPSRQCDNKRNVREDALREAVLAKLRYRLFPPPAEAGGTPGWLDEVAAQVRDELRALSATEADPRPALGRELGELEGRLKGYSQSLAKPELSAAVRSELEALYSADLSRRSGLQAHLGRLEAASTELEATLDAGTVLGRLARLSEVLAGGNVVEANRLLARHIEAVVCHADGRVELKTHRLGLFEGASAWFAAGSTPATTAGPAEGRYWVDPVELQNPARRPRRVWSVDHADEVRAKRDETGWTVARLMEHFGRCRETIDKALALASASNPPMPRGA